MESITEKLKLLKIDELKDILKGRNLPVSGSKEVLINRILKNPRKKVYSELLEYGPSIKRLGSGSYGEVTLHKTNDNKLYAIKTLEFLDWKTEDGLSSVALREMAIFKRMNHPNVLKLIDYGLSKDFNTLKLVMEYMGKGEVHKYIKTLPEKNRNTELKGLVYQMLCGIAYIHSLDILHRDLKPMNILINENKELKIADFGLSRALNCVSPEAKTKEIGTIWYRPPELLYGGRADQYGLSMDMWAIGVIIFELLTGEVLFQELDEDAMIEKISSVLGYPNEEVWPGISSFPKYNPNKVSGKDNLGMIKKRILAAVKNETMADAWFELITGLVKYNPKRRLFAIQAINNDLFTSIRNKKLEANANTCLKNLYLVENPINFTINPSGKIELLDWMLSMALKLRLLDRTYFLALYLHDILSSYFINKIKSEYELWVLGCLYIAASYNEVELQNPSNYIEISDKKYTNKMIINTCAEILTNLDFKLVFSTNYDFCVVYGKFYSPKVQKLSRGLLFFLSLLPEKLYQTKPDQVALLSIMMACLYYEEKFKHYGYVDNNLIKNMNFCIDLVLDNKFKTAEEMFKSDKYHYSPKPETSVKEVLATLCKKKLIV